MSAAYSPRDESDSGRQRSCDRLAARTGWPCGVGRGVSQLWGHVASCERRSLRDKWHSASPSPPASRPLRARGADSLRLELKAVAFDPLPRLFPCIFATEKDRLFVWPLKLFGSCLREVSVHRTLITKQRPFFQPMKGIASFRSP